MCTDHRDTMMRLTASGGGAIKEHVTSFIAILAVSALPAIITMGLILVFLQGSLTDSIPSYLGETNDAIHNWREIYTASQVGFNGGYITANERPARATFTHFYAYGPVYPILYGIIGHFLGWGSNSPAIYHMVLITLVLLFMLSQLGLETRKLGYVVLVLVTFWPLLLYLPSNMMETTNQAFALMLVPLFYRAMTRKVGWRFVSSGVLFILLISSIRLTWILLLFPFLFFTRPKTMQHRAVFALIGTLILAIPSFFLYSVLNSGYPYPNNHPAQILANLSQYGLAAFGMAANAIVNNFFMNFIGTPLEFAERFLTLAFLIYLLAVLLQRLRRRTTGSRGMGSGEAVFHTINIGLIVGGTFLFYGVGLWHDYRLYASPLLLSLVLLVAFGRCRIVLLVSLVHLVVIGSFFSMYRDLWSPQYHADRLSIAAFREETRSVLVYDDQATNGWCNTLLFQISKKGAFRMYPELMIGAPPGIGLSYYMDYQRELLALPPHSKFLLLNEDAYAAIEDRIHVRKLVDTRIGTLYLNLDAPCGAPTQEGR